MFCKLIVVLVCLMGAALGESSSCPVFVLGSNSPPKPSLKTISEAEFANMLPKETMKIAFMYSGLSQADFACSKSSTQERASCFTNMKEAKPKTYYTKVMHPIEAMLQVSPKVEHVNVDVNGNLENDISCEHDKTVLIDLSSVGDNYVHTISRSELLELIDEIIHQVSNKVGKNCNITSLFTCTQSPTDITKNRRRRAVDTATSGTVFHSGKDFLLFYTDLAVKETVDKKTSLTSIKITEMNLTGKNDTAFTVNLSGGADKLSFLISLSGGYFKMSDLVLNDEKFYVSSEVNSPTDFSYTCGNQTFATKTPDSNKIIVWNSLQMQAPFNDATPNDFKFGDPWYCVGFFSSGILAGLFVVFILLGIMSVGICWMLDINTMDRFDDPKGKTITINVNE